MRRLAFAAVIAGVALSFSICQFVDRLVGISIGQSSALAAIPATPLFPTISNPTSSSLTLTWSAVNGSSGYAVYRATSPAFPNPPTTLPTAKLTSLSSASDTTVVPGTTYYYVVQVLDTNGNPSLSPILKVTTPP